MSCTNRLMILLLAALLVTACQPVTRPVPQALQPPHGLRYDAPEYAVDGPHAVGVRYFTIPARNETDRELTVSVWYPALNPDAVAAKMVYEQQFVPGAAPPFSVNGRALLDAPPDASGAPYPLVVYTHAHWSFAQEVPYLAEHLASRGFVVIAADHEDNWSTWGTGFGPMAGHVMISRPQEVTRQIDYAASLAAPGGDLAGIIDTSKVGVAGWSMGGTTGLEVAGARLDLNTLRTWCAENPDGAAQNAWACVDVLKDEAAMASFAGLQEIPAGLWPDLSDARVRAVVDLAGASVPFGPEGIRPVAEPVLFMVGSGETAADPAFEMAAPYENISAERKAKVVLDHADHVVFNSSCVDNPEIAALGYPMFCTDSVWDMDRAHDLVNHFATAFLLAELKGDGVAAATLAPENVSFPGVTYTAAGYAAAAESALDDATTAKIESMVDDAMAKSGTPGMALGIVKDSKIAYLKGFGVERIGSDNPVTVHSVFGTGSVGKTATATAIMQLVEAGKVDLNAPVTDYLPYFKLADERYKDITVYDLITHRSGLPEIEDWFPVPAEVDDGALERYIRGLGNVELLFAPGEQWSYSGMGFVLLAGIVEEVTGQTFEAYLQEHVIDPLGMYDTMLIIPEDEQSKVTGNHVQNEDGQIVVSDIFPYRRQFTATGPLYSSITDMARYVAAQLNRGEFAGTRILPTTTYDVIWKPISVTGWDLFAPITANFGMGWGTGEIDGHREVDHFGFDEGYCAVMLLAPDDNLGVVMISNYFDEDVFDTNAWQTAIDVMRLMLAENQ